MTVEVIWRAGPLWCSLSGAEILGSGCSYLLQSLLDHRSFYAKAMLALNDDSVASVTTSVKLTPLYSSLFIILN